MDGDRVHDTGLGTIAYAGHSLGGIYGTIFLAVDSRVRVGVLAYPGGPVSEVARLSPVFRPLVKDALLRRSPPLLNLAADFREDLPLRGDEPITAPAPGALAIQDYFARVEGRADARIRWRTRGTCGGRRSPDSSRLARRSSGRSTIGS